MLIALVPYKTSVLSKGLTPVSSSDRVLFTARKNAFVHIKGVVKDCQRPPLITFDSNHRWQRPHLIHGGVKFFSNQRYHILDPPLMRVIGGVKVV